MPRNEGARKSGKFIAVCVTPDVCLTPMGNTVVPVPYQIVAELGDSRSLSPNVHFGGDPTFICIALVSPDYDPSTRLIHLYASEVVECTTPTIRRRCLLQ